MSMLRDWWLRMATALQPAAGFALEQPALTTRSSYAVPGLAAASAITVFQVIQKNPSAEQLYMSCAIATPDNQACIDLCYTGRNYGGGNLGYGLNTYTSAFTTADDLTVLDNAAVVLMSATLVAATPDAFALWLNGEAQPITIHFPVHYGRAFGDNFTIAGNPLTPEHNWPGTIYHTLVYLRELSPAERRQTEAYLKNRYQL